MNATTGAIWHDVECGSYEADLALWEELAERRDGPVLELGCGTGRVALHLARRGHEVIGLDRDPELLSALESRGTQLPVRGLEADARAFDLAGPVSLVLAPTHLLQLLADSDERAKSLRCIAASLRTGGLLAAAIIEAMPEADGAPPPLPDVREVDGWVYSSQAVEAAVGPGEIVVRRLRQAVSPDGSLTEESNEVRIVTFSADAFEAEAEVFGLVPAGRRAIPETDLHVGSLVVLLEKGS
ncbi:MAG TPA: class I SAM-dependent methyltransferase [Solirubrobacterales bacterium]|nr:class I SAM-dependent methyltransferase [Solirubrobacterales bacterium]